MQSIQIHPARSKAAATPSGLEKKTFIGAYSITLLSPLTPQTGLPLARPAGYVYANTRWGAESGERQKEASWAKAIERKRDVSASDVDFVPFSSEVGV